ncbi:MAG: hypothetical protein WCF07_03605, partial [Nitrososphaeraceae archaeon]
MLRLSQFVMSITAHLPYWLFGNLHLYVQLYKIEMRRSSGLGEKDEYMQYGTISKHSRLILNG